MEKESSRKDVLQLEKRLVDLELAITELKESIKSTDVSMVPDLKQRIDDVEDLIMVEQAGVLELKKMLEESKPEKPAIPEDLEGRLKSIEDNIPNLVGKVDLESRLEDMQKEVSPKEEKPTPVEIEGLYNKLTQLESSLSELKTQTENLSKEFGEKINELSIKATEVKQPSIDLDLLASKIEAGKNSIEGLSRKRLEVDLKIEEITKKMEILESRIGESPEQQLTDGLKLNRREITAANARIDSLERVARELMGDVQNSEKTMRKFESIEKISLLSESIDEKLERLKFIEEEVKRLTSKIEMIYDEIDKRLEKVRGMEGEYSKTMSILEETVESNKKQIQKMKKEDALSFERTMLEVKNIIEEKINEIESKIRHINKPQIGELRNNIETIDSTLKNLNEKILLLENEQENLDSKITKPESYKEIGNMKKKLSDSVTEIDNRLKTIEGIKADVVKEREVITNLSKEIGKNKGEIENLHRESKEKIAPFTEKVDSLSSEYRDFVEEISQKTASIGDVKLALEKRMDGIANEYKNFAGDVSKRIISIENIKPLLGKRVDELTKELQPMIRKEVEPFIKRNESLEKTIKEIKLDDVNRILTDVTTKIAVIESKLNLMEKGYGKKVAEVSPRIQEKVVIREPSFLEEQFKEVVNRMIFLESRLVAVEGMMQDASRALPIVIE